MTHSPRRRPKGNSWTPCPRHKEGCQVLLKPADVSSHFRRMCLYRPVTCEGCGVEMTYGQLLDHEDKDHCMENATKRNVVRVARQIKKDLASQRAHIEAAHFETEKAIQKLRQKAQDKFQWQPRSPSIAAENYSSRAVSRSTSRPKSAEFFINEGSQAGLMVPSSARELAEQQRLQTTPASRSRSRADSSPDVEQFQICRRCDKIYAERMNHRNACSWHRGMKVGQVGEFWNSYSQSFYGYHETLEGSVKFPVAKLENSTWDASVMMCFHCGSLDYQRGCQRGRHQPINVGFYQ